MVMALGALDGQAEDPLADAVHAVEHGLHAELLGIDAPFLVDHRIAEEARGDELVLAGAGEQVAGDLLDDELVIREVPVQGVDDPIAVGEDLPGLVLLVAVRVGITSGVEPDPPPALAILRRVEEPVDQPCVGILASVGDEGVDLRDGWRQADQVEAEAADEGDLVGLGRGRQALGLEPGEDEAVDRVAAPAGVLDCGKRRTNWR